MRQQSSSEMVTARYNQQTNFEGDNSAQSTSVSQQALPLQRLIDRAQAINQQSSERPRVIARPTIQRQSDVAPSTRLLTQAIYGSATTPTPLPSVSDLPVSLPNQAANAPQQAMVQSAIQRTADTSQPALSHPNSMAQTVTRLRQQISDTTQQVVQREITQQSAAQVTHPPQIIQRNDFAIQGTPESAPEMLASEQDVDQLVEKVWRKIIRRLGIERERRGGRKWF